MAKFETIVRPVIFPNIRPVQTRTVLPESDPTEGFAVIHGASGRVVNLPYSWSVSTSRQRQTEVSRRVDRVRVSQKEDDGTVNPSVFIDLEIPNKLIFKFSGQGGSSADVEFPVILQPVKEADNIEILERNVILENPMA